MRYYRVWIPVVALLFVLPMNVSAQWFPLRWSGVTLHSPSLSAAWSESRKGLIIGGMFAQGQNNGATTVDIYFDTAIPVKGIWVGASERVLLGSGLALEVTGKYLFTNDRDFSYSLFNTGFAFQQPETRSFDAKTDRWYLDASASYMVGYGFQVEVGLRYDYHAVKATNPPETRLGPIGPGFFLLTSLPQDEVEFCYKNYIPYVGVRVEAGNDEGRLTVGVRGFPAVFSEAQVGLTTNNQNFGGPVESRRWEYDATPEASYFLEVYADYGVDVGDVVSISLFGTWRTIHTSRLVADLELLGPQLNPGGTILDRAHPAEFSVQRSEFILGGNFSTSFASPI